MNIGLIGFGLSGRYFHAPFINNINELNLKQIYTRNFESRAFIKAGYPLTKVVENALELIQSSDIDAVVVASPNAQHFYYAKAALEAGKHVIVEKPFTINVHEADELIDLSNKKGKMLTVFQNRRFDSDFKTVKKVIESNELGKIREFEAHMDRYRNHLTDKRWKEQPGPGAGIVYDLGPHLIDQAVVLFGMPKKLFADIRIERSISKTADYFEIILFYERLKVTLKAGMLVKEKLPKYILTGENGNFVKYGNDPQEEQLKSGMSPDDLHFGVEDPELSGILNTNEGRRLIETEKGDYREFYRRFALGTPAVFPSEAKTVIRLVELALKSSQEERVIEVLL